MSATLQATGLAAGHGPRALFADLDLVVAQGDVIGLVGANGAGKSTLLRILAGEVAPAAGTVTLSPRTATVGHLPQEPERIGDETILGFLGRRTGVSAAQRALDDAAAALATGDEAARRRTTRTRSRSSTGSRSGAPTSRSAPPRSRPTSASTSTST